MLPARRLIAWVRSWSLGTRIFTILGIASVLLFLFHWSRWAEGEVWSEVTVLEVHRARPGHRDGTLRRFELTVRRGAFRRSGYIDTYWFMGRPAVGQVVDLRAVEKTDGYYRFHHAAWSVEFRPWLVALGLFGLALACWRFFVRRARRREQAKNSRD